MLHTYLAAAWSAAGADKSSVITLGAFCRGESSGKRMTYVERLEESAPGSVPAFLHT